MTSEALTAQLLRSVAQRREEVVGLCAALVAAPSVNPDGDTRAAADVVVRALADLHIDARRECLVETMPSVIADIDSGRPGPRLVLNVHLDTMAPGDESAWTRPVWELTREQGRLYGLGMGNMKGAVAAMVTAAGLLVEHRDAWCGSVTFTAVSDEVVFGDHGAAHLLATQPHVRGDALICGEGPGFRRLALGEKGVLWVEVTAEGPAGHASAARWGESASVRIARAVTRIDDLNGLFGHLPPELDTPALPQRDDDPALALTANVGTVTAGTFVGQCATRASAEVDLRLPPGVTADEAFAMVTRAVAGIASVSVRRIKGWDANWTSPQAPIARAFGVASQAVTGAGPLYALRLPASDASRWRRLGVPALCYGPQPTLSSGVDDHAEESEVLDCVSLYALTALEFLRADA